MRSVQLPPAVVSFTDGFVHLTDAKTQVCASVAYDPQLGADSVRAALALAEMRLASVLDNQP